MFCPFFYNSLIINESFKQMDLLHSKKQVLRIEVFFINDSLKWYYNIVKVSHVKDVILFRVSYP